MVQEIPIEKFNEWTRGLNPKESRMRIFEQIRDISYAVIPEFINPESGPTGILSQNRGSCSPKHFLMGMMYEKLGVPIRYATYPFNWSDSNVDYPTKVRKLANEMPTGYHVACKTHINREWVLVDATWDPALKKVGFPVNESWDGVSDTLNAVKPQGEIIHENAEERMEYVRAKTAWHTEKEKILINRFYSELNKWLEEVRISK